jgi:hypothetical protein
MQTKKKTFILCVHCVFCGKKLFQDKTFQHKTLFKPDLVIQYGPSIPHKEFQVEGV